MVSSQTRSNKHLAQLQYIHAPIPYISGSISPHFSRNENKLNKQTGVLLPSLGDTFERLRTEFIFERGKDRPRFRFTLRSLSKPASEITLYDVERRGCGRGVGRPRSRPQHLRLRCVGRATETSAASWRGASPPIPSSPWAVRRGRPPRQPPYLCTTHQHGPVLHPHPEPAVRTALALPSSRTFI